MPGGLVPLITHSAPNNSLYAPAGTAGGGGVPPNITVSSVTAVNVNVATGGALQFGGAGGAVTLTNVAQNVAFGTIQSLTVPCILNASTINVSSINGAAPGGSAGPNPSFSSISLSTTAVLNADTFEIIGSGFNLNNPITAVTPNDFVVNTNIPASGIYPGWTGVANFISLGDPNVNSASITMTATTAQGAAIVSIGAQTGGVSSLTIISNGEIDMISPFTSISSLNVSSINGAAPGASVPANLGLSTLSMSGPIFMNSNGILLDAASTSVLYYNSGNNNTYLGAKGAATAYIGTVVNPTSLAVDDTGFSAEVGSVSSLTVSSINGAAPGGGSITNVSTPSLAQTFVLTTGGAPVVPVTSTMGLTVGHLYNMSWLDAINTSDGTTSNSYVQYSLSTPTGFLPLDQLPGPELSTLAASSIQFHNVIFNAPGASVQLVLSQNGIQSTIVTLYTGQDIILRDLGPVV